MPRATKPETEAQKAERELRELETRNARLAEISKRHKVLAEQKQDIEDEDERLKAEAAELLDNELGKYPHNDGEVQIQPNRTWNEEQAAEVIKAISEDVYKACLENKLSSKKAKRLLPPATYEKCLKDGARPKVVFQ